MDEDENIKHPPRLEWLSLLCSLGIYVEAAKDIMAWELELTALLKKSQQLRGEAVRCLDMVRLVLIACDTPPLNTSVTEIAEWFCAARSFPAIGITIVEALSVFWPDMASDAEAFGPARL